MFLSSGKARLAAVVAITCLLLGSGCELGESNVKSGLGTQTLHLGNGTEPRDLDPHTVTGVTEHNIISALFEGLVTVHPETLSPMPGVAASWTLSEDGKVYRFALRENARWSNGDPVIAEDFVWSWQRLLSPALASEYAYQLYVIKNARQFNEGKLEDFSQVGVKAIDSHTLEVTLDNRTPYFLSLLSHFSSYPVHRETILGHGAIDERGTRWTRAKNLVGNGPFQLAEWRLNYIIRVTRNPHYWDANSVRLNEIRFYPVDNIQTEERMFRTDALHIASSIPPDKIVEYQQNQPERIHIAPYLGTYYFRFNTTRKPLDDPRVRQALSLCIDREMLIKAVTKGGQIPARKFTPPGLAGYSDLIQPATLGIGDKHAENVRRAKTLLVAAGYPEGQGFPALDLLYNTSDGHRRIAVAIQQMWKDNLNIEVQLSNQDWKVFLSRVRSLDYDIARAGWIGDYPDPTTFLDMFVSFSGNNQTGWANKNYDRLLAEAAAAAEPDQRLKLLREAEALLMNEAAIAPIYHYTRVELRHPSVAGWWPNLLDQHPYKYVHLEAPGSD